MNPQVIILVGHPIFDFLGLVGRLAVVVLLAVLLRDLVDASKYNGPILRRLMWVFIAFGVMTGWALFGLLEDVFNFLPGSPWSTFTRKWFFIPLSFTATTVFLLIRALRRKTGK